MSYKQEHEEVSTKAPSSKTEENPNNLDLELHSFDQKAQEKSQLISLPSNPYNNRHFGNNFVFCFRKNEPVFTLGPHCKKFDFS